MLKSIYLLKLKLLISSLIKSNVKIQTNIHDQIRAVNFIPYQIQCLDSNVYR